MRVLVTGGAGFIGSHLCEVLLGQGHQVVCMDNLSTGSESNVKHLYSYPFFEFLQYDITHPLYIAADQIYNLACPASPPQYQENPIGTLAANTQGVVNVLELARERNIPVLHTSTSEVYGDPKVHPQPETYWGNVNPIGERSCYTEGKRCAEALCVAYREQYGVDVRIARLFNTYGPKMRPDDGRVVSNFIHQALTRTPMTVYNGNQTRSFCYVTDTVRGLIALMNANGFYGPVNIGNPHEITILELARLVQDLVAPDAVTEFTHLPVDDPWRRCPDVDLAAQALSWQPEVGLISGLNNTIKYFSDISKASQ